MSQTRSIPGRTAAPAAAAPGAGPRTGLALLVIATAQLMVVLDATIVNVALPHIQRALGFSGSGLEWVVNAYALSAAVVLLACFGVVEARSRNPLLPLRLLADRDRTGANVIMLCVGTTIFGTDLGGTGNG
jgi:hypothetical protein